jgi:hypothetical protein
VLAQKVYELFQKFSVIGFAVRELQLLKVEGVEVGFME